MVSQHLHTLPSSTYAILRPPSLPAIPALIVWRDCLRPSPHSLAHVSIRIRVLTVNVCSAKHLLSQERLPFTATYFGSIGLTLWFAVGVRMHILPILLCMQAYPRRLPIFMRAYGPHIAGRKLVGAWALPAPSLLHDVDPAFLLSHVLDTAEVSFLPPATYMLLSSFAISILHTAFADTQPSHSSKARS